jgi:hypothetical protein
VTVGGRVGGGGLESTSLLSLREEASDDSRVWWLIYEGTSSEGGPVEHLL